MKEVKSYKTSDGQLFEDIADANTHEKELQFKKSLTEFCERYFSYYDVKEEAFNVIRENKEELKAILLNS